MRRAVTIMGPYLSPRPSLKVRSTAMGEMWGMKRIRRPAEKMMEDKTLMLRTLSASLPP
jgi:hypothetical protein